MPKKDVCYVTTDALEPVYLKGQIIAIKDPGFEWTETERGQQKPQNSKMRFSVKTLTLSKAKLNLDSNKRLVIIKKNGRELVDVVLRHDVTEKN